MCIKDPGVRELEPQTLSFLYVQNITNTVSIKYCQAITFSALTRQDSQGPQLKNGFGEKCKMGIGEHFNQIYIYWFGNIAAMPEENVYLSTLSPAHTRMSGWAAGPRCTIFISS